MSGWVKVVDSQPNYSWLATWVSYGSSIYLFDKTKWVLKILFTIFFSLLRVLVTIGLFFFNELLQNALISFLFDKELHSHKKVKENKARHSILVN